MADTFQTVYWHNGCVRLINQTKLPLVEEWLDLSDYHQVARAIKTMQVRGAPAIGVTAALGLALAAQSSSATTTEELILDVNAAATVLKVTRPTAVNLFWALQRMVDFANSHRGLAVSSLKEAMLDEAIAIQKEDIACNRSLSRFGAELIQDNDSILTHCNAGALACAGYGTALGVVRSAWESGKNIHVYADETRPLLQGARLTAWELQREGIPITLITDNMAGYFMRLGKIQRVIVGADRIAANGDTANKIGTYTVATMAAVHDIPVYVAAPLATIDIDIDDGGKIEIEERAADEVMGYTGMSWAPPNIKVENPAFDITPNKLITAIITEVGILRPPFTAAIKQALSSTISANR